MAGLVCGDCNFFNPVEQPPGFGSCENEEGGFFKTLVKSDHPACVFIRSKCPSCGLLFDPEAFEEGCPRCSQEKAKVQVVKKTKLLFVCPECGNRDQEKLKVGHYDDASIDDHRWTGTCLNCGKTVFEWPQDKIKEKFVGFRAIMTQITPDGERKTTRIDLFSKTERKAEKEAKNLVGSKPLLIIIEPRPLPESLVEETWKMLTGE